MAVAVYFLKYLNQIRRNQFHEYALIAVEDEEFFNPFKKHQFFDYSIAFEIKKGKNATEVIRPYRALLMITPTKPTNLNYEKFSEHVINRTEEAFKVPVHRLIKPQVPFYAGLAYDSVIIYAKGKHLVHSKSTKNNI